MFKLLVLVCCCAFVAAEEEIEVQAARAILELSMAINDLYKCQATGECRRRDLALPNVVPNVGRRSFALHPAVRDFSRAAAVEESAQIKALEDAIAHAESVIKPAPVASA